MLLKMTGKGVGGAPIFWWSQKHRSQALGSASKPSVRALTVFQSLRIACRNTPCRRQFLLVLSPPKSPYS